ncbi:MAG: hypothetical protein ACUZ8I_10585 [Candidatus Scalindua sp.]
MIRVKPINAHNISQGPQLLTLKRNTLIALLSVVFFRVLLDISYYHIISPMWGYRGLVLDVKPLKVFESYVIFLLMLFYIPKKSNKISHAILQLYFLVACIPVHTYYALSNGDRIWFYYFSLFWVFVITLNRTKLRFSFRSLKQGKCIASVIMIVFSMLSVILIYSHIGLSFNIDLSKVYEIRKDYAAANIPLSAYMIGWTAKVVLPLMILLALFYKKSKRSYSLLIMAVLFQFFIFSSSGHKSHLFRIPAIIGLAMLVDKKNFLTKLGVVFSVLVISGIFSFLLFDDPWVASLFTRRTFLCPAQLSFYYYDFFSTHRPIFLSTSQIFRSFMDYPYHLPPSNLIAETYFNKAEMNANNGIVANGFMNFGYIGIILWPLLLTILLKFADAVVEHRNIKIVWPILIMTFYVLVDGAPLTTLLTHGLFLAILLCYFIPKVENKLNEKIQDIETLDRISQVSFDK